MISLALLQALPRHTKTSTLLQSQICLLNLEQDVTMYPVEHFEALTNILSWREKLVSLGITRTPKASHFSFLLSWYSGQGTLQR